MELSKLCFLIIFATILTACATAGSPDADPFEASMNRSTAAPTEGTKEDIIASLQMKLPEVIQCYETQLEKDPTLSGRLEIELEIGGDGAVSRGQLLVNEVGSPLLEVCIVRTLTAWTFPPPPNREPLMLQIPFDFTPSKTPN